MSKRTIILPVAVLLAVTAAVFSPCLRNGFTNWDDWYLIARNPDVHEAAAGHPWKLVSSSYVGAYMPLTMLTYAADYRLWRDNPAPHHAVNLALHLANCALVFWCLLLLTKKPWASFAGALLFALHPLRVESVAWMAARKDLLYAFFFLASIMFYLRHSTTRHRGALLAAIACFVLSCLSKGLAVALPFVLLLCDYLATGRISRADLKNKIPFFVVAGVFVVVAFMAQGAGRGWGPGYPLLSANNILIGCYTLAFYLIKIVMPVRLSCLYPHPDNLAHPYSCEFWMSVALAILAAILLFRSRRYSRKPLFAAGFFFITILPVLQFFPVGGQAIAADRYTYVPAMGLSFLAAELLGFLAAKRPARKHGLNDAGAGANIAARAPASLRSCEEIETVRTPRPASLPKRGIQALSHGREGPRPRGPTVVSHHLWAYAGMALLLALLGFLSWQRCHVWKDSITLWSDTLRKYPGIASAWYNRGLALSETNRMDEAEADWTIAMALGHDEACNNRGLIRSNKRDYDAAIADYTLAIMRRNSFPQAYYNRANAWLAKKDVPRAIADYDRAIALNPSYAEAFVNRGAAFSRIGELDRAIADFERALSIEPANATARDNIARCRVAKASQ